MFSLARQQVLYSLDVGFTISECFSRYCTNFWFLITVKRHVFLIWLFCREVSRRTRGEEPKEEPKKTSEDQRNAEEKLVRDHVLKHLRQVVSDWLYITLLYTVEMKLQILLDYGDCYSWCQNRDIVTFLFNCWPYCDSCCHVRFCVPVLYFQTNVLCCQFWLIDMISMKLYYCSKKECNKHLFSTVS